MTIQRLSSGPCWDQLVWCHQLWLHLRVATIALLLVPVAMLTRDLAQLVLLASILSELPCRLDDYRVGKTGRSPGIALVGAASIVPLWARTPSALEHLGSSLLVADCTCAVLGLRCYHLQFQQVVRRCNHVPQWSRIDRQQVVPHCCRTFCHSRGKAWNLHGGCSAFP